MPTLVIDTIKGAEVERTPSGARAIRTGYVDDIDIAGTTDPDALVKVLPYLPAFDSPLGPSSPGLRLTRQRVFPADEAARKYRRAYFALTYETDAQPTTLVYMIRDRTYVTQQTSHVIPGTREPMVVEMVVDGNGKIAASGEVISDTVAMNFFRPARSISVTVMRNQRPEGGAQDYVGCVNHATWPAGPAQVGIPNLGGAFLPVDSNAGTSKPKGYWLLSQYSTETQRYSGMHLIQSEAISRVNEDWSEVAMLQHKGTGRYPFASQDQATRDAAINTLLAPAYDHGIISGGTLGIIRIGPYETADFEAIFGF
jgi:hypothetical protein